MEEAVADAGGEKCASWNGGPSSLDLSAVSKVSTGSCIAYPVFPWFWIAVRNKTLVVLSKVCSWSPGTGAWSKSVAIDLVLWNFKLWDILVHRGFETKGYLIVDTDLHLCKVR